ncbi:MAG: ribosome recycling factor [Bacteroidia bacterium]|nr:ribosome recycling factor [Bacteroidia bacterium]
MPTTSDILNSARSAMKKALEHLEAELGKIRAGKATPGMLDHVKIDYYGTPTPIGQAATVSVADARTLTVQPYESKHIPAIEKAIRDANLGITPQNDGILIRLTLPTLTEDRRKQLVKNTKETAEEARVAIRNLRRDHNDQLKKLLKDGEAEDAVKAAEATVQKITDEHIALVEKLLEAKEQEIMTV